MNDKKERKKLLNLLNMFLKHNSKARTAQKEFEKRLETYLGVDRLNDLMDWYIDLDESGASSATEEDLNIIIEDGRKPDM